MALAIESGACSAQRAPTKSQSLQFCIYASTDVLNESLWCHFNQPIHMEIRSKAIHKRNPMAAAGISIIDCAINAERVRNGTGDFSPLNQRSVPMP